MLQKIYNDETGNVEAAFSGGSYKITSLKRYIEKYSYGKLSVQSTIFPRVNGKVVSYVSPNPEVIISLIPRLIRMGILKATEWNANVRDRH